MSEPILILGASGSGKSYACRNLDPKKTLLVSVDGKKPPFSTKDWPRISSETPEGSFYMPGRAQPYTKIKSAIRAAVKAGKTTIVIDDSQYLMANEFFARSMERGYDKYNELGCSFWSLIEFARDLPDDVVVYMLHHSETIDGMLKPKTIGRMLDDKGCVEGRFTVCLLCEKIDGEYKVCTAMDNQCVIKAPPDMFGEALIENDLATIDAAIREYWGL